LGGREREKRRLVGEEIHRKGKSRKQKQKGNFKPKKEMGGGKTLPTTREESTWREKIQRGANRPRKRLKCEGIKKTNSN